MQLGELQSQYARFKQRGSDLIAMSVDPPTHSRRMIRRLGLEFPVLSDESQEVMRAYGVQNPDTLELALHAVFIVDEQRRVIYRKVASRRPRSQELLDAIDHYKGTYPLGDSQLTYKGISLAFPTNNFQALIEVATNGDLPSTMNRQVLETVISHIQGGRLDDATILYRELMTDMAPLHSQEQLLSTAAWLAGTAVSLPEEAKITGRALNQSLVTQRLLNSAESPDAVQLRAVERDLDTIRGVVSSSAGRWKLTSLKTILRGYRELSLAMFR